MKNKKIFILALLVVIMLFVWIRSCSLVSKKTRLKGSLPKGASMETESKSLAIIKQRMRPKSQYNEWDRSPFVLQKSKRNDSGLILGGIFWDKDKPQAIINNQIVGLGEELEGYRVIEIKKDRVILSDGANKIELRL